MPFFLILILLPFAEITVFFQVVSQTGFWTAFGLLVLGAIVGGALMRYQGFQTILSMRSAFRQGRAPLERLFDGFFLMLAGFLFVLPGFVSDVLALALLFPGVRRFFRQSLKGYGFWSSDSGPTRQNGDIIEGEYEDLGETRTEETLIEGGDKRGRS